MDEQASGKHAPGTGSAAALKRCPQCGGSWPADRRHCLACGASLLDVPATPLQAREEGIDWTWLDSTPEAQGSQASQPAPAGGAWLGWLAGLFGKGGRS